MAKAFKITFGITMGIVASFVALFSVVLLLHVFVIGAFTVYHLLHS